MHYSYSAQAYSLRLLFEVSGDLISPEIDSVYYTIYTASGTPLAGRDNVAYPTTATDTYISLTTTDLENTKNPLVTSEPRFVEVVFGYAGQLYRSKYVYTLIDSSLRVLTASPADVRSYLGVNPSELPDTDLDIYGTWLDLVESYPDFSTYLAAGDGIARHANEYLAITLAINAIPSLRLRVAQSETDNTQKYSRFSSIDWDALSSDLHRKRDEVLNVLDSTSGDYVQVTGVMSARTDPITNT